MTSTSSGEIAAAAPWQAEAPAASAVPAPSGRRRWVICALVFCAFTINYVDRQVLSILKPAIEDEVGWSEVDYANIVLVFQLAYVLGTLGAGRLLDRFGVRLVMSGAILLWALAAIGHALVATVTGFAAVRFLLALGESANIPGGVRAITDWFPRRERALANGLFNSGGNMGTVIAALIVPLLVATLGWRWAFVVTGALALLVLVAWRAVYRPPEEDRRLTADEYRYIKQDADDDGKPPRIAFGPIVRTRQFWALASARALTDPVWAFLLYWLPDFFHKRHGFDLAGYGPPLIAVYLLGDIGSVGGGWLSSAFLKRGWSINAARKTALFLSALAVLPATMLTSIDTVWFAVLVLGVIAGAHQSWSITLYTIVSDVFPRRTVATAVSLCSAVSAATTVLMIRFVGATLQATGNYTLLFGMVGVAYLIAFGLLSLLLPRLDPATPA